MTTSLISVIVPCYNQGSFLDESLQSILNQTYQDWECIIVNDGSTDDTEKIGKKWAESDSRFIYHKKENGGLSSARNAGLKIAKGNYIQFLDADDLLHKDKFFHSIAIFEKEESQIVITNFLRFKKTLEKTKRAYCKLENQEFNFKSILLDWDIEYTIPIHCGIFKKSLISQIQFEESLKAKEDWVFWLDLFIENPKVSFINQVLVYYRVNPKGMTRDNSFMEINQSQALVLIFNSLDEEHKELFFKRIINELSQSKEKFTSFKYNLFYRKFFYKIKDFFS